MRRRVFTIVFTLLAAVAGAFAGRFAADMRRQPSTDHLDEPDSPPNSIRPRDVVPGLIAALRVGDRPWSFLHIPPWLAAFAVNFGLGALAGDLEPLTAALRGERGGHGWGHWGGEPAWTEAHVVRASNSAPATEPSAS